MPVFRSGKGRAPAWSQVENFEFFELKDGESRSMAREATQEQLVVCRGNVVVTLGDAQFTLQQGSKFDLHGAIGSFGLKGYWDGALLCRIQGRWDSVTSSGLFTTVAGTPPANGSPYTYEKTTNFDAHYHDCDECWIFFEGQCTAITEGKRYEVGVGDCVLTGMGWHHDIVAVKDGKPIRAVWFETGLEGQKRFGHLWEPTHGKAVPKTERV